jgi:arabinofuranosyltransferase
MTQREIKFLGIVLVLLFVFIAVRNAWVSDDAYITFRTVENFRAGYGLGYNVNVRVQAFTHPLWMLLLSTLYFVQVNLLGISFSAGLVFLALFISIALSALTVFLLLTRGIRQDPLSILIFGAAVILSRAFLDYSTSGLENPLTHFLLALFLWKFFENSPRFLLLAFLSALIAINRLDALLLVAPALAVVYWQERALWRKNLLSALLGFSPLILWELFSLFYYGFLFPNTAYAKLNTGILDRLLVAQGLDYFLNSIHWDPLTLFVIGLAGVGVFLERDRKSIAAYVGVLLYLLYVVKIGGDFMSGRFLTAGFLVCAVLLARLQTFSRQAMLVGLAIVLALGVFSVRSTLFEPQLPTTLSYFKLLDGSGVADERLAWFGGKPQQGLVISGIRNTEIGSPFAGRSWVYTKLREASFHGAIGKVGYQDGPDIYQSDPYALVDPLLARLPARDPLGWRIGHFKRNIPAGYPETLKDGTLQIADPDLALYYEKLSYVVTGSIWNWYRVGEIWKFNTGQYDYLIASYVSRNPGLVFENK